MAHPYSILIIEDESNISGFMSKVLTANGYHILHARTGEEGLRLAASHVPDVMILDLGLPDMDGQSIIELVRVWSQMPIIVVSARMHEKEKVRALDMGADDYITKPFGTSELLARIRTALRHTRQRFQEDMPQGLFGVGDLSIDFDKRRAFIRGEDAGLTAGEFKIVSLLAQYAGRVLTYDYLIKSLWGPHMSNDNKILRVNMANIRRKIEANPAEPEYIFTEIGVGYRMLENEGVGNGWEERP